MATDTDTERIRVDRNRLKTALARQTAEIKNLSARIQESSEQNASDLNALRVVLERVVKNSQSSDEHFRQFQQFHQENHLAAKKEEHIRQEVSRLVRRLDSLSDYLHQQRNETKAKEASWGAKLYKLECDLKKLEEEKDVWLTRSRKQETEIPPQQKQE